MSELIRITKDELSLVENCVMTDGQLSYIMASTPQRFVRERPAKGGGTWRYVSGGYVRKVLNLMFGFDWDFEIVDEKILDDEVVVRGRLTVRSGGRAVSKTQYGNKDIARKRGDNKPLSIGNDLKAAATDALKKCAQDFGIASDVYSPDEFKEMNVTNTTIEELKERLDQVSCVLPTDLFKRAREIIRNEETTSYNKLWNQLRKY